MNDPLSDLIPEEKLLLSLCRLQFSEEKKEEIKYLMRSITDWDHFIDLSNKHGVIALCWYNLVETGNGNYVPSRQLGILHSAYLKNLTRNTFLFSQLDEIALLAKVLNIKIVVLKGLALEKTVYENKGLRQMADIDILVRQDDAALLRKALLINGFITAPLVSSFHEKFMPAYGKHLPEMYKNGIAVEIHFKLFDQRENSLTEEFLDKSICLPQNEVNFYYPDPQLFFLYLVKHLDAHEKAGGTQLKLYTDLHILLSSKSYNIINDDLPDYATEGNLKPVLIEKLNILNIFWKTPSILSGVTYSKNSNKEVIIKKFVPLLKHPDVNKVEKERENLWQLLKDVPRFKERALLFIGHIFPSVAYLKYRYKIKTTAVALLFYPVRWSRQLRLLLKRD